MSVSGLEYVGKVYADGQVLASCRAASHELAEWWTCGQIRARGGEGLRAEVTHAPEPPGRMVPGAVLRPIGWEGSSKDATSPT